MNLCGSWAREFHVILEEERGWDKEQIKDQECTGRVYGLFYEYKTYP